MCFELLGGETWYFASDRLPGAVPSANGPNTMPAGRNPER